MKTFWVVVISFVLTAVIVGGGTYYMVNAQATTDKNSLQAQITDLNTKVVATEKSLADAQAATTTTTTPATTDATAGWKTYTNTKYGYSFKYPSTVKLTAGAGNSDDLAINATAGGVYVFPVGETVGNGIFYVLTPGIQLTTTAIKNQFGGTKAENITTTSTTIDGASAYIVTIQKDTSVVSTFYFVRNTAGTVLELTVLNSSSDAKTILSSFKVTK